MFLKYMSLCCTRKTCKVRWMKIEYIYFEYSKQLDNWLSLIRFFIRLPTVFWFLLSVLSNSSVMKNAYFQQLREWCSDETKELILNQFFSLILRLSWSFHMIKCEYKFHKILLFIKYYIYVYIYIYIYINIYIYIIYIYIIMNHI